MLASASGPCFSIRPTTQEVGRDSLHPHNVEGCQSLVSKKYRGRFPSTRRSQLLGADCYRQASLHFRSKFSSENGPNLKANGVKASLHQGGRASTSKNVSEFASLTTSTQSASPSPAPSSSDSYPGSPLLWVGVGVALCVFVTKAADWLKKRLMQLAMEQMMSQMGQKGAPSPFGQSAPFPGFPPSSSPFPPSPYPPPPPFMPTPPPPPPPSSTRREEPASSSARSTTAASEKANSPPREAAVFVDVDSKSAPSSPSPTPTPTPSPASASTSSPSSSSSSQKAESEPKKRFFQDAEVVDDTANAWSGWSGYTSTNTTSNGSGKAGDSGRVTIEQLEQMLETPAIQNLVLQYVPEYMRNPDTIKWLLKNPEIRQKIEDQLAGLSEGEYGSQMADMLKQFDLNNPELTQQFESMGVTPEQAVQTIMSNPEVAVAFQNPKIQMAIMECAQNPANQLKYINDKEVMDVFEKISRLFPQTMQG